MSIDFEAILEKLWIAITQILTAVLPDAVFDRLAAVPMPIEEDMAL